MSKCKDPPASLAPEDRKYWNFFSEILSHGRITSAYQNHLLCTFMLNFKKTLIHASVSNNTSNSLEYFEKIGDTVVNMCVNWWLPRSHPEIVNIGFMDIFLSSYKGTKYLSDIALEKGWEKMVHINPTDLQYLKSLVKNWDYSSLWELSDYRKVFEDAIESFFGCLVFSMLQDGKSFGAGVEVAYNIFYWMIETTHFGGPDKPEGPLLDYEDIEDPRITLRDLYQNDEEGLKWNFDFAVSDEEVPGYIGPNGERVPTSYQFTVWHWDGIRCDPGEKDCKRVFNKFNRKKLYEGKKTIEKAQGKKDAIQEALKLLAQGVDQDGNKLSRKYKFTHHKNPNDPMKRWPGFYYEHRRDKYRIKKGEDQPGFKKGGTYKPPGPSGGGYRPSGPPRFQETREAAPPKWKEKPKKTDYSDFFHT